MIWRRKLRILHVEDDPSARSLVRLALSDLGDYVVESAGDALSALQVAAARTPDLVVLDLDLPGADGLDTLRALRAIDGMDRVPVLFLTASSDMMKVVEMLAAGARTVLQKPCKPRELVQAVDRVLGRKRR
jgi:DNA-binding response OmpR family regulator